MLYKLINPSIIQENLMNNRELTLQFVDLYRTQIPIDLQALKDVVALAAYSEIANKAHHIKPTMEYIGAHALREKLQQLEYAGRSKTEITHINTLFLEIEDDMALLLREVDDYYNTL